MSFRDFFKAGLLGAAICLALLAIKFQVFGWLGVAVSLLVMVTLLCAGQRRLRWSLILPAILLGGLGYSAAFATVAATTL